MGEYFIYCLKIKNAVFNKIQMFKSENIEIKII